MGVCSSPQAASSAWPAPDSTPRQQDSKIRRGLGMERAGIESAVDPPFRGGSAHEALVSFPRNLYDLDQPTGRLACRPLD